jgi:predicted HTH domain antitoxin
MNAVTLEYPDQWLAALGVDESRFARDAKMAAAVKFYEVGRFSSGQAAQFAGVSRAEFLLGCREWGVDSVKWDAADLEKEFSTPIPLRT